MEVPLDFFTAAPRPPLDRFVECFWATRGSGPYTRSRVLPNGALQLMFNFGAPHRVTAIGGRDVDRPYTRHWIAGLQDQPLSIASPDITDVFAVRFKPGGAHAFLGGSIGALTNEVISADDGFAGSAAELHERLWEASTRAGQLRAAADWLLLRLSPREPAQSLVERAAVALARPAAGLSVAQTCERLGLSNKHLIELFRRHVGLAPKTYARVRRFHAALGLLLKAGGEPRADLALRLGYADQAHFNRDFKRLAGVTPGEFVARHGLDDESLILG